jgi:Salmonella virulence plasmid 28.1kDa A protein
MTDTPLSPLQILEMFKENHPDLNSIEKILDFTEEDFVNEFTSPGQETFGGDKRKARQAYRSAQRIQEQIPLLWANLREIGSPVLQNTLFNNIPDSFIEHFNSIPAYKNLFGNLDYTVRDPARSILSPAAYFVDLLRFTEKNITSKKKNPDIPPDHTLEKRQPRLFRLSLDKENTYDLVPYIDLVNEVLEDIVRDPAQPDKSPYQILEEANFPIDLPFHLPLEEVRIYLQQLKISLEKIYRLFSYIGQDAFKDLRPQSGAGAALKSEDSQKIYTLLQKQLIIDYKGSLTIAFPPNGANFRLNLADGQDNYNEYEASIIKQLQKYQKFDVEIAREILALSPREYQLLRNEIESEKQTTPTSKAKAESIVKLEDIYVLKDLDGKTIDILAQGKGSLEDIETFIEITKLTHKQLNELLYLDLSNEEIQAGLARLHFINNTGESKPELYITPNVKRPIISSIDPVNEKSITELNQRIFPELLRSIFTKKGVVLSDSVTIKVNTPNQEWEITNALNAKIYSIRARSDKQLEITKSEKIFEKDDTLNTISSSLNIKIIPDEIKKELTKKKIDILGSEKLQVLSANERWQLENPKTLKTSRRTLLSLSRLMR